MLTWGSCTPLEDMMANRVRIGKHSSDFLNYWLYNYRFKLSGKLRARKRHMDFRGFDVCPWRRRGCWSNSKHRLTIEFFCTERQTCQESRIPSLVIVVSFKLMVQIDNGKWLKFNFKVFSHLSCFYVNVMILWFQTQYFKKNL